MKKILLIFISTIFCQDLITTKQFNIYVSNEDSYIDFSDYINNVSGLYTVKAVKLDNLQWDDNKKKIHFIENVS